ncbi:MAG TPA: WecB/TagA/CpsF family glycosyltransferase [Chthoniobacter sp.]|jgi:N-acetylglucosaminyldiphosphoundecaprenol N-acetyl-beta-D-mannosaminyltransferase
MTIAPPPTTNPPRSGIAILGVPFDSVTMDEAVELIEGMVASGKPHYLATANVDFTVQALEDEELRRILFDAHLVLCDGTPLVWASRWLGNRLPERVAGSDLVPILIALAARQGYRVYFLGGRADVTARAIENIRQQHPTLNVVGSDSPDFAPLHEMDHEKICARIRAARPDLLFVSFGCPKQEKWIAMNFRNLGVPVCAGVGATIDFLAGEMARAPKWMRSCGLEWLFRLLQEPRRLFQRYVKDFWVFGWGLLRQWQMMRPGGPSQPVLISSLVQSETSELSLPDRFDAAFVASSAELWESLGASSRTLLADASHVGFIDSTGVGALIRLRRLLREKDAELILVAPSPSLLRGLELMKLSALFVIATDLEQARARAVQIDSERKAPVQFHRPEQKSHLGWSGDVTASTIDGVWDRTAILLNARTQLDEEMSIDLENVRFLDSAGLGFMVRLRRMARQHGKDLRFVNPSEPVQRVVRLAKLESFLLGGAV